jgi:Ca-activated chloride channel family protein
MTALAILLMTEDEVACLGRAREEAGFGALETARGALPLIALDVDARVTGVMASIEIAQTFVNTTGTAIEATYIFPLPERAAVHRFRMEVAGRVIEGVVDERGAAREAYDQAIAAGHRAAITEQERSNVFTLRVGNLMPREHATVRLSLVGPLPVDDGEVTFRFPLVVAPRYIPGTALGGDQAGLGTAEDTSLVPDASRISPPVLLPGVAHPVRLGLRVALADAAVHEVASSLHAVTTSLRDARVIEVHAGERLDRDFILRWRIDQKELRSSLVCADDADGKAGTFMLTFVPPSTQAMSARPRDVVFVIDRSGSMEGWKMVAARRAAARMIDTLTSRDRFHVVAFDNVMELVPGPQLVSATDRNRFAAIEALSKLEARGGTELHDPLRHAVGLLAGGSDERERVVVLVTDGQVGNEDHILRELVGSLRNVRVFALGIDQAVNDAFLRRLAAAGGGLCELVESEDRLDEVMARVHRRIGRPVATELALDPVGLDVDRALVAPRKLPDVYAGAPVVVLGRYRGRAPARASVDVRGTTFGDPLHFAIARGGEDIDAAALAASWARSHLRELEDRYATGAHQVESEIVAVSKRFGVLSRFTAYLAVDRAQVVNPGGYVQQLVQPVEEPAGWELARGGKAKKKLAQAATAAQGATLIPNPPMIRMPSPARSMTAAPAARAAPATPSAPRKPDARDAWTGWDDADESQLQEPPAPPVDLPADVKEKREAAPRSNYLVSLDSFAKALDRAGRAGCDRTALRILRERLTELAEDLRSVGGHDELAEAIEYEVRRLGAALTVGDALAAEVLAIAAELARLASGSAPSRGRGRPGFWK